MTSVLTGKSIATAAITIARLVAEKADAQPDAAAICATGRAPMSYGQLHRMVERIGEQLRAGGCRKQDRVALVVPNGPEAAVAFVGIASSASCAPLSPAYREGESFDLLRDLRAKALVVEADAELPVVAAAQRAGLPIFRLHPCRDAPAGAFDIDVGRARGSAEQDECRCDDEALVLHTSGTTAKPKIVPLTHANLCRSAENTRATLDLSVSDLCLNVMPLFHIHGLVGALLSSLAAGASIACTSGFHASRFFDWIWELAPSWYTAVPTMHQAVLLRAPQHAQAVRDSRLRLIRSSSAPLAPQVMRDLSILFRVPVVEAYGMTEASHQIASNPLSAGQQRPGSVGLPAGSELRVVDEQGHSLPSGACGEVVIRGETVTLGYDQNPQANAQAFIEGWFRTGDQGYLDADGYLFLTGRLKELINRGGEKISPREIDEVLLEHPAVGQAVAFAVPDERLGEEVAAVVVLKADRDATARELREFVATRLADFKVPRTIQFLDELPKGPTGKLQRVGLAATLGVSSNDSARPAAVIEPRTPLERELARTWSEILGVTSVGIEDDFFQLGGDSLAAAELLLQSEELFGLDVPYVHFVECPTIKGMLACREEVARSPTQRGTLIPIQTHGDGHPILCTPGHDNRLWMIGRVVRHLGKSRPVYGLKTPATDRATPFHSVEQIVDRSIDAIAELLVDRRCDIIGTCSGTLTAWELAARLKQRGVTVDLLVLIDGYNIAWRENNDVRSPAALRLSHFVQRVRFHQRQLARVEVGGRLSYLEEHLRLFLRHWYTIANQRYYDAAVARRWPLPAALLQPLYANQRAARLYRPGPYDGRVLLIGSSTPAASRMPLPRMGWAGLLTGEVAETSIACERSRLWQEPNIGQIAVAIRDHLSA